MTTCLSSRLNTEALRMACRGLAAFAISDGFPEYNVDAQPQSSSLVKTAFICVRDGVNEFLEITAEFCVLWHADCCNENADTFCVDAPSASRTNDASFILLTKLVDKEKSCARLSARGKMMLLLLLFC